MDLTTTVQIYAYTDHGLKATKLVGFAPDQEKKIRQVLHQLPISLQTNFRTITAKDLGAKHGEYDHGSLSILYNPNNFASKRTFGTTKPEEEWEFVLLHEISHSIFYHLTPQQQQTWLRLSSWKKGSGPGQAPPYKETRSGWPVGTSAWTHGKDAQFVRKYQRKSPHEDFADNSAYYLTGNADQIPDAKRQFIAGIFKQVGKGKV